MGLRSTWRGIRQSTAPVRHVLRRLGSQKRIQRSAPLESAGGAYKRRRAHVLVDLIHEQCPGEELIVAEIGTAFGRTGAHLAKYCPQIAKLYAIDLREPPPESPIWSSDRVEFIESPSTLAADRFEDESFDLVFIDADHSEKAVLADLTAWLPKVKRGGVISGHDYGSHNHPDVKPVVDRFFANHAHPVHLEANKVFWTLK